MFKIDLLAMSRAPTNKSMNTMTKFDFSYELLKEFNMARTDPKNYAKKVEEHISFIKKTDNFCYFLYGTEKDKFPKVNLAKGEESFRECITYLENMQSVGPLQLSEDIVIKVPEKTEEMNNKEKIGNLILEKKKYIKDSYKTFHFHYDHGYNIAEISAVLQIVDDTNSSLQRRNNILTRKHEYLGVSIGKIQKNRFIIYVTFASSKM
jgi:hypothetical protein